MQPRTRGFTLIELMIVVAVVAILAAIALPSFLEQTRTARRSDALAEVGRVQMAMERWRADNPSYVTNAGNAASYPTVTSSSHYAIALSGQSATGYTLTATKQGSQTNDRCGNLTATAATKPTWSTASCN